MLELARAAATTAILGQGCGGRCGDIEIQYPFGFRADCAMDKWFVIDCIQTANSTSPFISSINLEVLNINYTYSRLLVKGPIFSYNCSHPKAGQAVDLIRTSLTFSGYNNFTVVGCNNRAVLSSSEADGNGCQPTCDENVKPQGCSGNRCCQTSIPYFQQLFAPSFQDVDNDQCRMAFTAETQWFEANVTDPYKVQELDYVPVLLDWKINATALESLVIDEKSTYNDPIVYYDKFDFPYPYNTVLKCREGFIGNPYLPIGCQDINECEDPKVRSHCHGLCVNTQGSYKCVHSRSWITILGISVAFGALILLISTWWLYKFIRKSKQIKLKRKFFNKNGGLLLRQLSSSRERTKIFSCKELDDATDHFSVNRIIGQGGQGAVYKGTLLDGRVVAIKKSMKVDEAKVEEFINECVILSQINHRNVVKLLGCSLETEVPLLVYEFIPNGTLYQYLHHQNDEFQLTWEMRLRIATQVSRAISYLHSEVCMPIYHRDIKTTNILLDEKYTAKVSDFGVSRSIQIDRSHLTTHVKGTFGYVDPEYFQSSLLTEKSDVYSFGVVLVELLTGQKPISSERVEEGVGLAACFILSMEDDKLFDMLDPRIVDQCDIEEVIAVANLARRCLNLNGKLRPTMKEVLTELEGIRLSQKETSIQQNAFNEVEPNPSDVSSTSTSSCCDSPQISINIFKANTVFEPVKEDKALTV
ncbi:wall-associated receptor kinase-like 22 [Manihot esculenta]|uniref:Protein kinase domain-containing protein n=1 Tax=Manihot esculenta TaxID=3983 RepID=A0A2C9UZ75_MANES|nr:wall-associated receptor kinase-like 22 [Manihot esculenta]